MRELFQHYAKEIIQKLLMRNSLVDDRFLLNRFWGLTMTIFLEKSVISAYDECRDWWLSPWTGGRLFSHGDSSFLWPIRGASWPIRGLGWWPIRGPWCVHPLIRGRVSPEPPGRGQAQGYPAPGIVSEVKTAWNREESNTTQIWLTHKSTTYRTN